MALELRLRKAQGVRTLRAGDDHPHVALSVFAATSGRYGAALMLSFLPLMYKFSKTILKENRFIHKLSAIQAKLSGEVKQKG
jgi:hypothetical protein